jgi:hypothetical protein
MFNVECSLALLGVSQLHAFSDLLTLLIATTLQGVRATVWEGQKVTNQEVMMRLDQTNSLLSFDTSVGK